MLAEAVKFFQTVAPPEREPERPAWLAAPEGVLDQVDCLGTVLLAIDAPGEVTIRGSGAGHVDFACGPQRPESAPSWLPRVEAPGR